MNETGIDDPNNDIKVRTAACCLAGANHLEDSSPSGLPPEKNPTNHKSQGLEQVQ